MPVFIVLLGILIALAGFAALIFGIQNWAFGIGNTLIASGSIAAVGGLLLAGLGLVLRSLRTLTERIESLTPGVVAEFPVPLVPQELPLEIETPVPLPPLREAVADEDEETKPAYRREDRFKRVRDVASRIAEEPKAARVERPQPAASVDEQEFEAESPPLQGESRRPWPPRTATRVEETVEKKNWSIERPRTLPHLRTPVSPPQALVSEPEPEPVPDPEPEYEHHHDYEAEPAPVPATTAAVAVMRSCIISGMAYTLYSDGSIEAELPLGTVRFGSVEELRAHVARNGADADTEFGGRAPAT